jgi:hypothetical protein
LRLLIGTWFRGLGDPDAIWLEAFIPERAPRSRVRASGGLEPLWESDASDRCIQPHELGMLATLINLIRH